MTEKEFKKQQKKVCKSRKIKINNSIGNYDIYKSIRKNKWALTGFSISEKDFYAIIRYMNLAIVNKIVDGMEISLPCRMGTLEIRKSLKKVTLKKGKVFTNLPINWDATLSLWYNDEESRKNKVLVRIDNPLIFKVLYNKSRASYNNKNFYTFSMCRSIKQKIKQRASQGDLDAYLLYNYD